ncbi:MBL fold metallo-hydrolase [Oscillatoria sp. CS-180]|uniref:MBL fold metallo-hydrolase n=1 Tax=Oscillatoria sp. CS-180 TaxID=3021720 RepID=UPI00232D36AE|nr:MBL fold metallo-hydrolase [Oscillatoria sp. CS-180]MDB9528185.1 MBL fold metallo-hydrolase [Oscillatoria sp. CS-180]
MSELSCLPYGVGHSDEGICLQTQIGPYRVMLDCGLASLDTLQEENAADAPVDFVFCTHAHSDHARSLLALHQNWPDLPIYCSEATADLLPLNWPQIALPNGADFCQRLPWRHSIELAQGLTAKLWPAGHLPGAACILLTYDQPEQKSSLFYTGDFFLSNSRLVEGLPLDELRGLKPDVLVVEGSNGTARYPHRRQQENRLADQIKQAIAAGHNILLPVPRMGLGQELLMLLRSHHHFTGQDLTVWVDPWVAEACDIYLELLPHLPSNVQNFARHQPLFWDDRILPRIKRLPEQLPSTPGHPTIVLGYQDADLSELVQWGDVPWRIFLPDDLANRVVNAGLDQSVQYSSPTLEWLQRLGQEFEDGQAHLDTYLLSAHSDGAGTTQLIHNLRPHHVAFVHGSPGFLADLASLEDLQSRYKLHLPSARQVLEFPIGKTFLQPAAPDTIFEGEVVDTDEGMAVMLPPEIQEDPRWNRLADTGVVQIRWQGNDLIIRGITQQSLLRQTTSPAIMNTDVQCCFNCSYWRQPRCNNPISPMYGFPVAAEGYCPEFLSKQDAQASSS